MPRKQQKNLSKNIGGIYWWDIEDVRHQEREEETFRREELPGRFMTKKLFRWSDKRYNEEYWGGLEQNWR